MDENETDEHGRLEPPHDAGEAATLTGFLDYQRATLAWKCRGLSDAQLRVALPPTAMTLGGLLKHMALVEDGWFTEVAAEQPNPEPWASVDWDADPDWEWRTAAEESPEQLMGLWQATVERSRRFVAEALAEGDAGLDRHAQHVWRDGPHSLRRLLIDMIEEYARHVGHIDLIRESIDGLVGEDPA